MPATPKHKPNNQGSSNRLGRHDGGFRQKEPGETVLPKSMIGLSNPPRTIPPDRDRSPLPSTPIIPNMT